MRPDPLPCTVSARRFGRFHASRAVLSACCAPLVIIVRVPPPVVRGWSPPHVRILGGQRAGRRGAGGGCPWLMLLLPRSRTQISADFLIDRSDGTIKAVGYGPTFSVQWGVDQVLAEVKKAAAAQPPTA